MKLLVIRFSALGDVAMTVPVIDSLARQYPSLEITVLSKPSMSVFFERLPKNVSFRGVDVKQYKGVRGMFRLFKELRVEGFKAVADLHDVLRSKLLRGFFRLTGAKVKCIDKGRKEKKELTSASHKVFKQLPSSFERYQQVFQELGFPLTLSFTSIFTEQKGDEHAFCSVHPPKAFGEKWIGVAPFAAHQGKILPEETTCGLIGLLAEDASNRIFLFGGGKAEKEKMDKWADGRPNVISLAGSLSMEGELSLISHLDVMVSMDSANMHLASLVGTPVVSVWGATHPYAGFMGWNQLVDNAVQVELPCRPCSVFGNKPCHRNDYACLTQIKATDILTKIQHITR